MKAILEQYRREQEQELEQILDYWMHYTIDHDQGGFFGKIDHDNVAYPDAPKGVVLNCRILWTFSAACIQTGKNEYRKMADRAFDYIIKYFIDSDFGGVYWSVDHEGQPLETKKQIYALAFAIYGLSEYYLLSRIEESKTAVINLYETIEKYSHDPINGGYFEALTREWNSIDDLRLSSKDANEQKSMNTHLHVLEAYSNLYRIWPDEKLKLKIFQVITIFLDHIIDKKTNHLILFFNEEWNSKSDIISYGHDIEAAWLIQEAAETIGDENLVNLVKQQSLEIAKAAIEGLDEDGGLWYEYDQTSHHLIKEKHWWPQAEAMVGFFNAWQIQGNPSTLNHSLQSWEFTKTHMKDAAKGEWYWGVREDYSVMKEQDKVGLWKCPYHNGRACIELIRRITASLKTPYNDEK